jgi:hypothetical protein
VGICFKLHSFPDIPGLARSHLKSESRVGGPPARDQEEFELRKSKEDTMKKLYATAGIGMLAMMLGVPSAVWAQDEPKPPNQEEPKAEPKPPADAREPKVEEPKAPKQDEMKPGEENKQRPEASKQEKNTSTEGKQQERPEHAHVTKPAGKSAHIPDDKFRQQFGRQHTVVIRQPVIVEGQPRFQYSGYWFVIVDPWPADWAYTDDCYIDYVNGEYFLFDLLHPGVRIALFVTA